MNALSPGEPVVAASVPGGPGESTLIRESVVIRLVYTRKSTGKLWVQRIELKTVDVESRLFDVLLVSWGRSDHRQDLDFVLALDEEGQVLATIEGLTLYVAHTMADARDDYVNAQMAEGDD